MGLSEYIAMFFIEYLNKRLGNPKAGQAMFSAGDISDFSEEKTGGEAILEPDECELGITLLSGFLNISAIRTPHATPRYVIGGDDFRSFIRDLETKAPQIYETSRHLKVLGWAWLAESINNAAAKKPDVSVEAGPPLSQSDWSPLEIERPDPDLESATRSIEAAAEAARTDNGYAATEPAERAEVVSRLDAAVRYLRDAPLFTASAVQVYVLWPLEKLLARFSPTTLVGSAAKLAKDIFVAWLKKRGVDQLDDWF